MRQNRFPSHCVLLAMAYALVLLGIQIGHLLNSPNAAHLIIGIGLAVAVVSIWRVSGPHTGMPPGIVSTEERQAQPRLTHLAALPY